jgi:hypothetical protein
VVCEVAKRRGGTREFKLLGTFRRLEVPIIDKTGVTAIIEIVVGAALPITLTK